jgi:hypothetical protein
VEPRRIFPVWDAAACRWRTNVSSGWPVFPDDATTICGQDAVTTREMFFTGYSACQDDMTECSEADNRTAAFASMD